MNVLNVIGRMRRWFQLTFVSHVVCGRCISTMTRFIHNCVPPHNLTKHLIWPIQPVLPCDFDGFYTVLATSSIRVIRNKRSKINRIGLIERICTGQHAYGWQHALQNWLHGGLERCEQCRTIRRMSQMTRAHTAFRNSICWRWLLCTARKNKQCAVQLQAKQTPHANWSHQMHLTKEKKHQIKNVHLQMKLFKMPARWKNVEHVSSWIFFSVEINTRNSFTRSRGAFFGIKASVSQQVPKRTPKRSKRIHFDLLCDSSCYRLMHKATEYHPVRAQSVQSAH